MTLYDTDVNGRKACGSQSGLPGSSWLSTREEWYRDLPTVPGHIPRTGCPENRDRFRQNIEKTGSVKDYEITLKTKDGRLIDCLTTSTLNERRMAHSWLSRNPEGRNRIQTSSRTSFSKPRRWRQSAHSAGGIAHDFNNLLTVVMGFSGTAAGRKRARRPGVCGAEQNISCCQERSRPGTAAAHVQQEGRAKTVPMNLNKQIVQVENLLAAYHSQDGRY